MKNVFGYVLILSFVIGVAGMFSAAQQKEARVTQVIKEVRLLAHNATPRSANLNDTVMEGNAVRTGGDSRAELTFTDQTLTRIGANTVFSFGAGAKEFDLASGAMLLAAPKSSGTVRVNTAGATAAVSGFTMLFESHKNSWNKWIVLEGSACVKNKSRPGDACIELHAGDMLLSLNGNFTDVKHIDIARIVQSANLITDFPKLPPWSLNAIQDAINDQQGGGAPPGGYYNDQTGGGAIDQRKSAQPTVTPPIMRPPHSPPPSFRTRP